MNDLQSTSLILSASFSFTSCCFSCVVVFVREKENWQCFRAFCHTTFQHALITCCNVAMYHDRDTFDFSQGHVANNQPTAVPVQLSESQGI